MVEHKKPRIVLSRVIDSACGLDGNDPPPWTNELHGLSQALFSKTPRMRIFWWFIILTCMTCGTTTTVLVILEYIHGPTATSTTIRLVNLCVVILLDSDFMTQSLELPAITICPKIADAFNLSPLFSDMRTSIPEITDEQCIDLLRFWIGGTGFENMKPLQTFNETYLSKLNEFYHKWSKGYTYEQFFNTIHNKYGYSCRDLFYKCELGGRTCDCCSKIFQKRVVMRRGICYETRRGVNQTEADDIGRLIVLMKALVSVTSHQYDYVQPQMIVYVTDNYDHVVDFPRFYLYQNQWNRMRFTTRFIELLQQPDVCTEKVFGKDAACFIRRWLLSNIVYPYNCTFPYLNITIPQKVEACPPFTIATNYYNAIQLAWFDDIANEVCTPGCKRWDYTISLQQTRTLQPFKDYAFNLEASYNELQYEHIKEVYTISVPGFMSQIGGQFGFFLGLSIITFIQITLYILHYCASVYPVGCSVQSSKRPRASCCFKRTISLDPVIQSSFGKTETEDGRRKRAHSQKGSTPDRIANISSNRWDEKGIRRRSYTIAGDRSPQGNFLRHFASVRRIASCMTRTKQEQMEEPLKWYSPCRISLCQSIESCTSRGSLTKRANANLSTLACHPIKRVSKRVVTQPENVVYSEGIPTISRMLEILTP
uniref:Uncharacterized protein n=1 Tax=Ascaris lumbricoides TaxID=6252 RepID=A0A9J2PYA3_ASCLU